MAERQLLGSLRPGFIIIYNKTKYNPIHPSLISSSLAKILAGFEVFYRRDDNDRLEILNNNFYVDVVGPCSRYTKVQEMAQRQAALATGMESTLARKVRQD